MMLTKSKLAIILSKLKQIEQPKAKAEQYTTEPEIAATVLWSAYMKGDIEGKTIADLGCGNGILGIGALLLGAKKACLVDNDAASISVAEENLKKIKDANGRYELLEMNVKDFDRKADVAIQNPPFGTRQKHADKEFLERAFKTADIIYSFHKLATQRFVEAISRDNGFKTAELFRFDFPLKKTMKFHKKRIQKIEVGCWKLAKQKLVYSYNPPGTLNSASEKTISSH